MFWKEDLIAKIKQNKGALFKINKYILKRCCTKLTGYSNTKKEHLNKLNTSNKLTEKEHKDKKTKQGPVPENRFKKLWNEELWVFTSRKANQS